MIKEKQKIVGVPQYKIQGNTKAYQYKKLRCLETTAKEASDYKSSPPDM